MRTFDLFTRSRVPEPDAPVDAPVPPAAPDEVAPAAEVPNVDVRPAPVAQPAAVATADTMEAEVAQHWDLWAAQVGHAVRADVESLKARVPTLRSAMVTTVDGYLLTSTGLSAEEAETLASLSGALHTAAATAVDVVAEGRPDQPATTEMITLHHAGQLTIVVAVPRLIVGTLLLWVTADASSLGVLLIHARAAATSITDKLASDVPAGADRSPVDRTPSGSNDVAQAV